MTTSLSECWDCSQHRVLDKFRRCDDCRKAKATVTKNGDFDMYAARGPHQKWLRMRWT